MLLSADFAQNVGSIGPNVLAETGATCRALDSSKDFGYNKANYVLDWRVATKNPAGVVAVTPIADQG